MIFWRIFKLTLYKLYVNLLTKDNALSLDFHSSAFGI